MYRQPDKFYYVKNASNVVNISFLKYIDKNSCMNFVVILSNFIFS